VSREVLAEFVRHVHPAQAVCWQVAAAAMVIAARQPPRIAVAIGGLAVALLCLTAIRVRGTWLYHLGWLGFRFAIRTRRHDLPDAEKAHALLALLLPGATARTMQTGQGPVLTISQPGGLTAIMRPRTARPEPLTALPRPADLMPTATGIPERFGIQAVFHSGARADQPPRLWLAVHAVRTPDLAGDTELTVVLRNALRRVRRSLDRAGLRVEALAEDSATAAIAGLAHVTGGRSEVREDWRYWRTGGVSQACFALDGWERLAAGRTGPVLTRLLTHAPGIAVTLTVGARLGPGGTTTDAVLRLAATTEAAIEATSASVAGLLAQSGVRLIRLDGIQRSGVAASLPIGGFLL
jgi:type VII secretion protein EccE